MRAALRLFGACAIALSALVMSRAYAVFIRRRVAEYVSILAFLELMKREISCRLCTPRELAEQCSDALLEEIGFLGELRAGRGLADAFSSSLPHLHLSVSDADFIASFFEKFGQGRMESELCALDSCIARFSARTVSEESGALGAIRLASTLFALVAMGLVILLL